MKKSPISSANMLPPSGILGREFLPEPYRDAFGPRVDADADELITRAANTKERLEAIRRDVKTNRQAEKINELETREVGFFGAVVERSVGNVRIKVSAAQKRIAEDIRPHPPVAPDTPARAILDEARRDRLLHLLERAENRDARGHVVKAWAAQGDKSFIDLLDYLPIPIRLSLLTEEDIVAARLLSFRTRNPNDFETIEGAIAALELLRSNLQQAAKGIGSLAHRLSTEVEPALLLFLQELHAHRAEIPDAPQNLGAALQLLNLDAA